MKCVLACLSTREDQESSFHRCGGCELSASMFVFGKSM